jgi:hypothetical protein
VFHITTQPQGHNVAQLHDEQEKCRHWETDGRNRTQMFIALEKGWERLGRGYDDPIACTLKRILRTEYP